VRACSRCTVPPDVYLTYKDVTRVWSDVRRAA
jgi:hypothetical protein